MVDAVGSLSWPYGIFLFDLLASSRTAFVDAKLPKSSHFGLVEDYSIVLGCIFTPRLSLRDRKRLEVIHPCKRFARSEDHTYDSWPWILVDVGGHNLYADAARTDWSLAKVEHADDDFRIQAYRRVSYA